MSENVLRILLRLFASMALLDGVTSEEKEVVSKFLEDHLNNNEVSKYMDVFEKMLAREENDIREYCTTIAAELPQKQQFVILLYLLELMHADHQVSPGELEFLDTVVEAFVLPAEQARRMIDFVAAQSPEDLTGQHVLLVTDREKEAGTPAQESPIRILKAPVEGELLVASLGAGLLYLVKYLGNSYLQLNHQYLHPGQSLVLSHGSVFNLPHGESLYFSDIMRAYLDLKEAEKVSMSCRELEFEFPNGNMGLRGVDLQEDSGRMVAIMGASGSGKSTLLNVLNGNYAPSSGSVTINGRNLHQNLNDFKGMIGYVPQDDLLIEELTVYQNLYFNAKLCHREMGHPELDALVLGVLADLGLSETRDLRVGNPLQKTISGGQRKRLNIGLELLRAPAIIFFDEPTSGLSSRDSENIMDLLKELTFKGKLIFVVIHQPSSEIFKMFDSLFILDTGGYPIYYGNPVEAVMYFKRVSEQLNHGQAACPECGNINPEQIFNIIETRVIDEFGHVTNRRRITPQRWHEVYLKYREKPEPPHPHEGNAAVATLHTPSWWRQFSVFLRRDLLAKKGNTQYLVINLLQAPLLAFILAALVRNISHDDGSGESLGYLFGKNENIPAFFFMSIVVALFTGMTMSAEEIFRDRKILKRENFLNLSRSGYLLAKTGILFGFSGLQMLSFVLISALVLALPGLYFPYWLLLFSLGCFAIMLGLNISATFNSAVTIYILIPLLIIPQLILSGTVVKFDQLNPVFSSPGSVPLAADMMASRWAYEGLMVKYFRDNDFQHHFYSAEAKAATATYRKDFWEPEMISMVDFCDAHLRDSDPDLKADAEHRFKLLRRELEAIQKALPQIKDACLSSLEKESYQAETDGKCIRTYLNEVKQHYILEWKSAKDQRDRLDSELSERFADRVEYADYHNRNHNEAIDKLVRNADSGTRIVYGKTKLVRKYEPIYQDANGFSAHFYAPTKSIFGIQMDTFWFNVLVIWLMTLSLYITLYFKVFRRVLRLFSRLG